MFFIYITRMHTENENWFLYCLMGVNAVASVKIQAGFQQNMSEIYKTKR